MTSNQSQLSLPPKENSLFKRIIRCYEQKQYRQGLKFCRQILNQKAFKEHGETLAMKGLLLNNLGKREEAMACVKDGIKSSLKSPICWHVYGLLLKSEKKYTEAIKCYQRALTFENDNLQILRDLSLNQIHIRDYSGYKNTRFQLLKFKPSQRISWLGYIVGLHLVGNRQQAVEVIKEFLSTQDNVEKYNYEHSEILLYNAEILYEDEKYDELAKFLEINENGIVDKKSLKEIQGLAYEKLQWKEKALKVYQELLERNPDHRAYYTNMERIHNFQSVNERLAFYDESLRSYPRATLPRLIPLEFLEGQQFIERADDFIRKSLQKCVPTLFVQLRPLYSNQQRREQLEKLFIDHYMSLKLALSSCSQSSKQSGDNKSIEYKELEPASTRTWAGYLLAQHFSHIGKISDALKIAIDELKDTPTLIEWYTLIASIYQNAADPLLASEWMIEAQSLDTADRYINSQCVQYLINANRMPEAAEMAAKFTREGSSSVDYLDEMQCMWFLTSSARMHRRLGELGDALKRCHEVDRHFNTMLEDQLDFHIYCLRKGTLRAYVKMLKMEDTLQSHSYYGEMACMAIEIYLHIYDQPTKEESSVDDVDTANMTKEDLKKLRTKQRKERRKAEQEATKARAEQEKRDAALRSRGGGGNNADNADNDKSSRDQEKLDPLKLVATEKPLDDAMRFLEPLLRLADNRIETHCFAYEIYERKKRPILMLRAIVHGARIPNCLQDAHYHQCLCRFLLHWRSIVTSRKAEIPVENVTLIEKWNLIEQLFIETLNHLTFVGCNDKLPKLDASEVDKWNERYLQNYGWNSLDNFVAVQKVKFALDSSQGVALARKLVDVDLNLVKNLTPEDGDKLIHLLLNPSSTASFGCNNPIWSANDVEPLRLRLTEKFPFARTFFSPNQLLDTLQLEVICPTPTVLRPKLNDEKSSTTTTAAAASSESTTKTTTTKKKVVSNGLSSNATATVK